jgi:hypothetical protein
MMSGLLSAAGWSQRDQAEGRVKLAEVAGIGGDDGLVSAAYHTTARAPVR